jgi:peptidoglycan/LPS O-acetylase OafA/YrhL
MLKKSTHPTYRADIDGLRALAIILVIFYHAFPKYLSGGFIGVDVFFVISGYLITGIIISGLNQKSFSFATFYARRVRRIVPALSIVILAVLAFGWLVLLPDELSLLGHHVVASALFVSNIQFWTEAGYFDTAAPTKPLLHLWSLGVEEQFYLFWPLLLWAIYPRGLRPTYVTFAIIIVSFLFNIGLINADKLGSLFHLKGIHADQPAAFYLPISRFWELLVGAMLVMKEQAWRPKSRLVMNLASLVGLSLIILAVIFINETSSFPGCWAILPTVGAGLIVWAGATATINKSILSSSPFVGLGLISYPLYLWHWPLLSFEHILAAGMPTVGFRMGAIIVSFVLALGTYFIIEKPIRHLPSWRVPVGLLIVLVIIAIGGVSINYLPRPSFAYKIDPATTRLGAGRDEWAMVGCGVPKEDQKLVPDCYMDRREPPVYAIWGDSKAGALFAGLIRESTPGERWLDIGAGSCAPMIGIRRVVADNPAYDTRVICPQANEVALKMLESSPDIKAVVMLTATYVVTPEFYAKEANDKPYPDAIIEGISQSAQRLHDSGKAVYFLLDSPSLSDPKECLQRLIPIPTDEQKFCSITLQEKEKTWERYREILDAIKKRNPFIIMIDPTPILCPDGICSVAQNGKFLYSYTTHYSDVGNGLVARFLIDRMKSTP